MAGFQQYNFFPTDLFYPRPHPSAVQLPMQTAQEQNKNQTQHHKRMIIVPPRTNAHLSKPKGQPQIFKKLPTHAKKPLSWALCLTEEDESDAL